MKKTILLLIMLLISILLTLTPLQVRAAEMPDMTALFDEHGAVMLLIDSESGEILYGNEAAASFYGYDRQELLTMNIAEINTLSAEEIELEMAAATSEQRNFFRFSHRLASGELREVEVYSYPVSLNGKPALFSIVFDITEKVRLAERSRVLIIGGVIAVTTVILVLAVLLFLLNRGRRRLARANQEIRSLDQLRTTFLNANTSLIYLKDDQLRYIFANETFERISGKKADDYVGISDPELFGEDLAGIHAPGDLAVLQNGEPLSEDVIWKDRIFRAVRFPVRLPDGRLGVGAYITDTTAERAMLQRQEMSTHRSKILLDVFSLSFRDTHDLLDYVLHRAIELTSSQFGYIFLYNSQNRELTLSSWSRDVLENCTIDGPQTKYKLDKTGLWGEVVRQERPVVINDYEAGSVYKKGYPAGHVAIRRFMSVPVIIDGNIVAVLGLANKAAEYDADDVYESTLLMGGVWQAVERRQAQEQLILERNKYLQTLVSIGDGVLVVDRQGRIEMMNDVAQKLTGWANAEAKGRPYGDVLCLSHEQEGQSVDDPIAAVLRTGRSHALDGKAVLTARDGSRISLEDSAAPINDENGENAGVVMVFRDATNKREQQKTIEYLSFHDDLTGLYNRRFFEEELARIDTSRNLPISLVMGDVNGLKLTNDVFGHACGDGLLKGLAGVLRRVCRTDDIIARWGGDEFILLLPGTGCSEALEIAHRIQAEFAQASFMSIKGSVSMGVDCKNESSTDMAQVLRNAEERMYLNKSTEQSAIQQNMLEAIVRRMHKAGRRELEHAVGVSSLCEDFGHALGLSEDDVRKLRDSGYLHDIGKVVLDPRLLNKNYIMTEDEWNEIKKHPIVGYRILNTFDQTVDLAEAVLAHQEHWDGTGYPKGLKQQEIPLHSRIIALAEGYERLVHDSDNREAFSDARAIEHLRSLAGSQYDPDLTELFARMLERKTPDSR